MSATQAAVAILVAIIAAAGGTIAVLLRNSGKSPETKDAQTNGWGQLNDRVNKQLDWLTAQVTSLRTELALAFVLIAWQRTRIAQLVKHIRDKGDTPPDPDSPEPGA